MTAALGPPAGTVNWWKSVRALLVTIRHERARIVHARHPAISRAADAQLACRTACEHAGTARLAIGDLSGPTVAARRVGVL
jgi:hypothetical protein